MKTTTPDLSASSSTENADIAPDILFAILRDGHRRYVLRYLSQKVAAVPLTDLAEQIIVQEERPTRDRFERVLTGLYHVHLPKLEEAGIVRYDVERGTVELLETAAQVTPHLDLVATEDH